jgi:formyl-CoA transferase
VKHPTLPAFETIAPPIKMSLSDLRSDRAGPALGAHTGEILAEAGLDAREIEALVSAGGVASADGTKQ